MDDLGERARLVMLEQGFRPDVPAEAADEAARAAGMGVAAPRGDLRDLREILWSSIDNRESRDLDQLEWAERLGESRARLCIAVADVDALVPRGSAIDRHAALNTTSVYTGVETFPMIPDALSADLTSLHEGQDRLALVLELEVQSDGAVVQAAVSRAVVRNHARMVYDDVGRWLEGQGAAPAKARDNPLLAAQLRLQDEIARWLKSRRQERGALELETIEARPITDGRRITGLELTHKSRAREVIEDFMLSANEAMAGLCERRNISWIRRMVRSPARWDRLVRLAVDLSEHLPQAPDRRALGAFLVRRRAAAPERFAELSLAVVKLMGAGEYALERAGEDLQGHFGLAVEDYTHATAPNRRYADLVTQRLVKAALAGQPAPYTDDELSAIAARCTEMEDKARAVERTVRKLGAAALLAPRVGERFQAVITGVSAGKGKATFARLESPPAEGRVVRGEVGLSVGQRVAVRLVAVDEARGFIDFARD